MSWGYEQPLSQTAGRAPAYSFGKPRGGRRSGKIHKADVQEIRRWAVREGFGMSCAAQARAMQRRYPGLAFRTLEQILSNTSWHDPTYDRQTPHVEWLTLHPALLLLLLIRQMHAPVNSPLEVNIVEEPGLAQRTEGVLDGAAIEPAGLGEGLRGAHVLRAQDAEHAACAGR